ncbi:hypothetical protein CFC21_087103 [Triticum aestivum]|uniref:DUF6598 domain-containing protein n=2 Tax=Triticum aestivum TaxID=4565 RepID=A0A3B6PG51_WHEAT|nr:hypothetical protein CFC21_087103 [Triticum aestivum]
MATASGNESFMSWIRCTIDALCDRVREADERPAGVAPGHAFLLDESIHGKVQLLAEIRGWRTYLEEIVEKLGLWNSPSKELCSRRSETLLELTGQVERLRLFEKTAVDGGRRTLVDSSVDQIVKDIMAGEEAEQIAPNDDGVEEDQQPSLQLPAGPNMPVLRNDTAVAVAAAVGGLVTPFHMETFDLKSMVADLSGVPMAKLKMQAETEDEVLLLWEPGDKAEQPPPSSKIRANFLSARLEGHDVSHGGRVDYQFFSPPIDFDTEEESPLQPGRHTDAIGAPLQRSANVLSIKVTSSGVASFPLSLYGSVVVRDALDDEGICLFHRERDDPQLIASQGEPLLLTGPTRGLVVFGFLFFDFNLKLKTGRVEDDIEFIRDMMEYNRHMNQHTHISDSLSSPLGAVELGYMAVQSAIESTVEIRILKNSKNLRVVDDGLYRKISVHARTTKNPEEMVLFDSTASGAAITVGDDGVLELSRRVVAVSVGDSLVITVGTWDGDGGDLHTKSSFVFAPLVYGEGRAVVPCAGYTMQIKVVWSALFNPKID